MGTINIKQEIYFTDEVIEKYNLKTIRNNKRKSSIKYTHEDDNNIYGKIRVEGYIFLVTSKNKINPYEIDIWKTSRISQMKDRRMERSNSETSYNYKTLSEVSYKMEYKNQRKLNKK